MSPHIPLGPGSEFDAIRALVAAWGPNASGIGDDAAVLDIPAGEKLVVSTDASVENVHFRREWLTPREIGARAAGAALSDLAAMAATPRGLLLAIALPASWRDDLAELGAGVGDACARAGCPIVGGNISAATELSLTITVLGSAATPLSRAGARAGDAICVTGTLGGPGAALSAWLAGRAPASSDRERFASPIPRLREAQWLAQHGARAAIDVSDGLASDAAHLARASRVTIEIDAARVPTVPNVIAQQALASGEEYELLVAMPAEGVNEACRAFEAEFSIPLTVIGRALAGEVEGVRILGLAEGDAPAAKISRDDPGRASSAALSGHDHLR